MDLHYESCPGNSFCNCCSCADDIGFVRAMLAFLEANFCIDKRRVYATGSSYGGMMTYQLALSMPDTFAAFAPAFGGLLKGFADIPASSSSWVPILDIHGWYDPWVPANDTHGCRTGDEPGCVGGGDGYSWPESSELEDGWAKSDDGWYYTPVDTLLGRFAQYSGCQEEPDTAQWPRWEPLMLEDVAATETAAADSLYCVAASECRGGASLARCSWEGGHSWKREWMPQLVWGFFSTYARGDIGADSSGAESECPPDSRPVPSPALLQSAAGRSCPILLDVRTEDEWNAGHASCAVRLPVQDDPQLNATVLSMAGGDRSAPIATYCRSGGRAGQAESALRAIGFTDVTNVGGWVIPRGNDAVVEAVCRCQTAALAQQPAAGGWPLDPAIVAAPDGAVRGVLLEVGRGLQLRSLWRIPTAAVS